MFRYLPIFCVLIGSPFAHAALFELKDGDRVALLGDAFIEREQYEGWIELAATTDFADRNVTFRNLGWSGDTPAGASRCGLSLLQAGLEPAGEGWRQLVKQLETYKPSVLITGYGMAASLPGGETPEEFRKDFERLLDQAKGMRVIVLGTPPRFLRDGETNETANVSTRRDALAAINRKMKEVAAARNLSFVGLDGLEEKSGLSDDGIHLNGDGYQAVAREIEKQLGWSPAKWGEGTQAAALRRAILRKNEWFFDRSRPANMAYIFGFRKAEQGRNAGEIEAFDKLVAEEDSRIAQMRDLSTGVILPEPPLQTESLVATHTPQPHPKFTVADGFEVTLWAENPLLHKPTQMNFDAQGRLWVTSSETYPQVEVGQTPNDKVLVIEDSDGDGKADRSTVFAEGMMMPTAVLPGDGGCYVAQSTDLLHFTDTDGDGKADTKRRVLSGFGTEDTHHNLHTLRRGPDGKLWMNQSIYTRSDTETPGGVMRLRSGGIMRFDPRNDHLETVFYGWCNPWGHQFDRYGQSFVTDGAGGGGINWAVPGAMYFTYANAGRILDSISPGSYPKFCGLEIIESPVFPDDWQGTMITCDFRAHRVVRFAVAEQGSGYAAQEVGDLLRTEDVNFRPIDVKLGPEGALYIADWSNPIINHGEVDFRDPRRDREHGRIWRVTKKGAALAPKVNLATMDDAGLLARLTSDQRYLREQAMTVLMERKPSAELDTAVAAWQEGAAYGRARLAALWLAQGRNRPDLTLLGKALADPDGRVRAAAVRVAGDWLREIGPEKSMSVMGSAVKDSNPRVRLEGVRVLAELSGPEAMNTAFLVLGQPMDRFLEYALWLNFRDHGDEWLAAVMDGRLSETPHGALEFALANLPPERGLDGIRKLMPQPLPRDGKGPWIALATNAGAPPMLGVIFNQVLEKGFDMPAMVVALRGLESAVSQKQITLPGDVLKLRGLFDPSSPEVATAALRLAGAMKAEGLLADLIADAAIPTLQAAAIDALSNFESPAARDALIEITNSDAKAEVKRHSALALARHHRAASIAAIRQCLTSFADVAEARAFWQQLLSTSGMTAELAQSFREQPLNATVAALNLPAVPDIDENAGILEVLRQQAGSAKAAGTTPESIQRLAKLAAEKGDASRGEMIFRQPTIACTACHAIGGAGGKVGPDMTSIGASAPLDYLVESVLLPGAKVKEGYHSVVVETRDGRTLMGRLVSSGGGNVVLGLASGETITLADEAVIKRTDSGSLMPANLIASLDEQQQLDLFKFLSQLGRPGEFDATKSRSPRVWGVLPIHGALPDGAVAGDSKLPWAVVNGTVNGRLLAADVLALAGEAKEVMAAARFELAEAGNIVLSLPDGPKPTAIWVDGKPVESGSMALEAGPHVVVVRYSADQRDFRLECSDVTFLPAW